MRNDGNMRALVIEDDREMAGLVKGLLRKRFSISADIAGDCAEARRMLSETGYDMITLDYRLPDGAGLDLLDEITESREHPPVIMVTGHGDEETAARSFRSRASGYVVKDSRLPDMLTEAVDAAVADLTMKRMEEELLDEKAFTEKALDSLNDVFAVLDIDGNLLRWNGRLREVTGYSDAELASLNILDLFAPEAAPVLSSGMSRMKSQGTSVVSESTLISRAGEKRTYEISGRAMLDRNGIPIGFCGIGRDTTERKDLELSLEEMVAERTAQLQQEASELELARQALSAGEQQLRAVFDNSLDIISVFDSEGVFVSTNEASTRITGYTPGELIGTSIFDLVHPEDIPVLQSALTESLSDPGRAKSREIKIRHRNGAWLPLDTVGQVFITADGEPRIVVNSRDAAERKSAEEALRRSEEKYRSIFELSPDFVYLIDREGYVVDAGSELLRQTGMSIEEMRRTKFMHFFAGGDEDALRDAVAGLLEGRPVRGLEFIARTGDRKRHYEVNAIPLYEDGEAKYILSLARDVTERRHAERELQRLNSELEGYAYAVSHDLKTPLTSIKLAGDTLARTWEKRAEVEDIDAEIRRISEVIAICASQAEQLIGDLLSLAVAGQEPEEVSEVEVADVVRRVLEDRDGLVKERNAEVRVEGDLGTVTANPTHIYQLFGNLIDNAIRHNDKPRPLVEISYLGELASGHAYDVKDNGPGIPPDDAERVFLPFFKGESGYTGIGLAIVDKIARLYGGSVRVRGGNGSCFELRIRGR